MNYIEPKSSLGDLIRKKDPRMYYVEMKKVYDNFVKDFPKEWFELARWLYDKVAVKENYDLELGAIYTAYYTDKNQSEIHVANLIALKHKEGLGYLRPIYFDDDHEAIEIFDYERFESNRTLINIHRSRIRNYKLKKITQ